MRIKVGVIGTPAGLSLYSLWVDRLSKPISRPPNVPSSVFYPGFREIFSCDWGPRPDLAVVIAATDISNKLRLEQRHEAVFETVGLFADGVKKAVLEEEAAPDLWFVVIPDEVYQLARPRSFVPLACSSRFG